MSATGFRIRSPGITRVLASSLVLGLAIASGCGRCSDEPATTGARDAGVPGAGASAPAQAIEAARTETAPESEIAYDPHDLGFPGCADGGCPEFPDSTFVPTPGDIIEKMLELAQVSRDDLVYDLGSGDGRSVIAAARIYGSRSVGVELNPGLAEKSRQRVAEAGLSELVEIRTGDMFEVDISDVDVLVLYQPPKLLERMKPQLHQLAPGARIVSHFFLIPGIEPEETLTLSSKFTNFEHKIHLWKAPLPRSETAADEG